MTDDDFKTWADKADHQYDRQKKFDSEYWQLRNDRAKRFKYALFYVNGLRCDKWSVETLEKVIGLELRIAEEQAVDDKYLWAIKEAQSRLDKCNKSRSKSGKKDYFNEAKNLIVNAMRA